MNIVVEVPQNLSDAIHCTPQEFTRETKMAMTAKPHEMRRLSSGMAAALAGVGRVEFLLEIHRYGVAVVDLSQEDLDTECTNA